MAKYYTKTVKKEIIARMTTEPEKLDESKFVGENLLFSKARQMKILNRNIRRCKRCEGLNVPGVTEAAPGWGDLNAEIFFIGQSLCTQCVQTMIPFTKRSGYLLDLVIRLCNLKRKDVFISNLVHCHPPKNRASTKNEIRHCKEYLLMELGIVNPCIVVALGGDAQTFIKKHTKVIESLCDDRIQFINVYHPAYFARMGGMGSEKWAFDLSCEIDSLRKRGQLK